MRFVRNPWSAAMLCIALMVFYLATATTVSTIHASHGVVIRYWRPVAAWSALEVSHNGDHHRMHALWTGLRGGADLNIELDGARLVVDGVEFGKVNEGDLVEIKNPDLVYVNGSPRLKSGG